MGERESARERERERQTDRQTEKTDKQSYIHTDGEKDRSWLYSDVVLGKSREFDYHTVSNNHY